ncbi:hypothetical protein RFI_10336 [Reticulomyxa filosa]|uniref:C2H2-type domain-containing protein n=1 Tax=Reticulomyxa filosa TaxID=46433 RepID=X6NLL0_RETFI|nr:hypothetical protein RFI_10336 [Reticulomyxa filosa]|eukprot:ETO26798.1 hypothetical protein RFI_10336 [Reticulomyxa filosa]
MWCNENSAVDKSVCVSTSDPNYRNWFYVGVHVFAFDLDALKSQSELKDEKSMDDIVEVAKNTPQKVEFDIYVEQPAPNNENLDESLNETKTVGEETTSSGSRLGISHETSNGKDLSQTHTLCSNCRQWISNTAYTMHSIQCARINWKCDICHAVVNKAQKDKHKHCLYPNCAQVFDSFSAMYRHIQLRHIPVECDLCHEKLLSSLMLVHQKHECLLRLVPCQWCGMKLKFALLTEHETYCQNLTVECELCGQAVRRKGLENHLASEHGINPTLQSTLTKNILASNLGLDDTMDWTESTSSTRNTSQTQNLKQSSNDIDKPLAIGEHEAFANDAIVTDLKRQLSSFQYLYIYICAHLFFLKKSDKLTLICLAHFVLSVVYVYAKELSPRQSDTQDNVAEQSEKDSALAEELYDFVCPYCKKFPPKSVDFADHLANCSLQTMNST